MRTFTTLASMALVLVACGEPPAPETPPELAGADEETAPTVDVDAVASVAKEVAADPAGLDAALEKANMTEDELYAALYAIAADPALSAAYEVARQ